MPEQTQLPPGRKLDKLVAEAMGLEVERGKWPNGGIVYVSDTHPRPVYVKHYSTTPQGAFLCREWIREQGFLFSMSDEGEPGQCVQVEVTGNSDMDFVEVFSKIVECEHYASALAVLAVAKHLKEAKDDT